MSYCEIWLQEKGEVFEFSFLAQIKGSKVVVNREKSTTIIACKSTHFNSALSIVFDKETFSFYPIHHSVSGSQVN